jgi:hypothetical protein
LNAPQFTELLPPARPIALKSDYSRSDILKLHRELLKYHTLPVQARAGRARVDTFQVLGGRWPRQDLRITFDRPETYNSVDAETHTELTHIWHDINEDFDIGAVIVTG